MNNYSIIRRHINSSQMLWTLDTELCNHGQPCQIKTITKAESSQMGWNSTKMLSKQKHTTRMIAIKNSINCYQLEKLNSMKEKRHIPKRNTAMQHDVKPAKGVIYLKIWLPKFISNTTLHNVKAINYPPLVLNNFNSLQVKECTNIY